MLVLLLSRLPSLVPERLLLPFLRGGMTCLHVVARSGRSAGNEWGWEKYVW